MLGKREYDRLGMKSKKTCIFEDIVPNRGGEGSGQTPIKFFFAIRTSGW